MMSRHRCSPGAVSRSCDGRPALCHLLPEARSRPPRALLLGDHLKKMYLVIYLRIYVSTCLLIHLRICLSLSLYLSICLFFCLFSLLFIHVSICLYSLHIKLYSVNIHIQMYIHIYMCICVVCNSWARDSRGSAVPCDCQHI